jgi:AcrR family transcriptional regulator
MTKAAGTGESETASVILQAADELFGERGFDGVSIRDVTERAGVQKALVFYYFRNKEGLFRQVLGRYYEAHRQALEAAAEADQPLRERLHGVVDAYLDFIDQNRRYPRLVQREVASRDAHLQLIQQSLAPLFRWTVAALSEVAPEEGPLAARHFFLTFSGAVINTFTYGPALEPVWGSDPLSEAGVAERRAHLHWLVDTVLDRLASAS